MSNVHAQSRHSHNNRTSFGSSSVSHLPIPQRSTRTHHVTTSPVSLSPSTSKKTVTNNCSISKSKNAFISTTTTSCSTSPIPMSLHKRDASTSLPLHRESFG